LRNRILRFLAYGILGLLTGLIVALLEFTAVTLLLDRVLEAPLWQKALAPGLGLLAAALILKVIGRGLDPATSEEYIAAYHDRRPRVRLSHLPPRFMAGAATIGMGGAMGLEGPSIYTGATIGASMQHRLKWLFRDKDDRSLLVAGAAAGVAAIFKTPATGVLFALESPYKGDMARRALLPALVAAAVSYVTFVSFFGTTPIFDAKEILQGLTEGEVLRFDSRDLWGAALVGLMAGLGSVFFARMVMIAKKISHDVPAWQRVIGGGAIMAAIVVLVDQVYELPLALGPAGGGSVLEWVLQPGHSMGLLVLLLGLRMLATSTTLGAGGVGGLFIPLTVFGLITGRIAGELVGNPDALRLFPFIGLAAFLGAGYRTPLAAVMFVAESTGATEVVVPGLIAVAVSQVFVGATSVSANQRDTRIGHLERRFRMPITSAIRTDVDTVPPDMSLSDFVWNHALKRKELSAPVVDDGRYVGMVRVHDTADVDRSQWSSVKVSEIARWVEPARLSMTLREATLAMEDQGLEQIPVTDVSGKFVGVVTADAILKLDEILEETEGSG